MIDIRLTMEEKQHALAELRSIKEQFAARHWFPGTSGNLSVPTGDIQEGRFQFAITASGKDKSVHTPEDFLFVDEAGQPCETTRLRPSAETLIHCEIYRLTGAGAIFHIHTVFNNIVSEIYGMKYFRPRRGAYQSVQHLGGKCADRHPGRSELRSYSEHRSLHYGQAQSGHPGHRAAQPRHIRLGSQLLRGEAPSRGVRVSVRACLSNESIGIIGLHLRSLCKTVLQSGRIFNRMPLRSISAMPVTRWWPLTRSFAPFSPSVRSMNGILLFFQ